MLRRVRRYRVITILARQQQQRCWTLWTTLSWQPFARQILLFKLKPLFWSLVSLFSWFLCHFEHEILQSRTALFFLATNINFSWALVIYITLIVSTIIILWMFRDTFLVALFKVSFLYMFRVNFSIYSSYY